MKKYAFLFPGQGSQYKGMGIKKYHASKVFSEIFESANSILGYDLQQICMEGTAAEIADTEITQPAVFVTSVALFEYHKAQLPVPQFMGGHSLGEYTALACAGVLSFEDALSVVQKRGKLMKRASAQGSGAMLSIDNLDVTVLEGICADITEEENLVNIAAYNCSSQFVIAGHAKAVGEAGVRSERSGAVVTKLKVSAPFHCQLMAAAADELRAELQKYTYKEPSCKILSNITGLPYTGVEAIGESLALQMSHPVKWLDCIDHLVRANIDFCIEIGPGKTLRNLLKRQSSVNAYSVDDENDLELLRQFLTLNISSVNTLVTKCLGISMSVKNNNFDAGEYQDGVVQPYRAIKEIQARLEGKKTLPSTEDIAEAASHFCTILNTKKIKYEEKLDRLKELFSETGSMNLFPLYAARLN